MLREKTVGSKVVVSTNAEREAPSAFDQAGFFLSGRPFVLLRRDRPLWTMVPHAGYAVGRQSAPSVFRLAGRNAVPKGRFVKEDQRWFLSSAQTRLLKSKRSACPRVSLPTHEAYSRMSWAPHDYSALALPGGPDSA